MPAVTQRVRVQTLIIDTIRAANFHEIKYNDDHTPIEIDILTADVVPPASVKSNEIQSIFEPDTAYGDGWRTKRSGWTFEALVEFDVEVTLERFERAMMQTPLKLAPDAANGLEAVIIAMTQTNVSHPVTQQPETGTQVRFVFEVISRN